MSRKALTWLVVIIVILIGIALYVRSSSVPQGGSQNAEVLQSTETSSSVQPQTGAVKEFTVTGKNFSFDPSTITVNQGDQVKITFVNSGGFHDFRIDGYNVGTSKINGGAQESFEFTADKAGTFEYYCSVGTHRQMGMRGTLTVQ